MYLISSGNVKWYEFAFGKTILEISFQELKNILAKNHTTNNIHFDKIKRSYYYFDFSCLKQSRK